MELAAIGFSLFKVYRHQYEYEQARPTKR
jgi:hypothetical protein